MIIFSPPPDSVAGRVRLTTSASESHAFATELGERGRGALVHLDAEVVDDPPVEAQPQLVLVLVLVRVDHYGRWCEIRARPLGELRSRRRGRCLRLLRVVPWRHPPKVAAGGIAPDASRRTRRSQSLRAIISRATGCDAMATTYAVRCSRATSGHELRAGGVRRGVSGGWLDASARPSSVPSVPNPEGTGGPAFRPMLLVRQNPSFSSPVWYSRVVLHLH